MPVRAQGITVKREYTKMPPKEGSKTQRRKANKSAHMQGTKAFK
jgi:hypothetical protein